MPRYAMHEHLVLSLSNSRGVSDELILVTTNTFCTAAKSRLSHLLRVNLIPRYRLLMPTMIADVTVKLKSQSTARAFVHKDEPS